ncbi:MAG: heparan-alpha-glucosaminide N-acetyltransferase domain-containing protein [Myxococcales bacterium]
MMRRLVGLDVARGLAVVLMIQTHAYDAWVVPSERASSWFGFTRLLGTLPLPLFLCIAGLNVGQRVVRMAELGRPNGQLQRELLQQAGRVLAAGYGLNVLYACLDGYTGLATFLRIDVLHCIGLSVALLAACLGGGPTIRPRAFATRCFAGGAFVLLACPTLTRLAQPAAGSAWHYLLAPWLELRGTHSMPVIPLFFFAASLAALGANLSPSRLVDGRALAAGAGLALPLVALGLAGEAWLAAHGMAPSRTNPGIWFNALGLLGRAGWVLGLTLLLARRRVRDVPVLSLLGRHSLLLYGLHLPLCYGRLAGALKRSSSLATASLWLLGLVVLCWLVAWLREGHARTASPALSLGS